MFKSRLGVIAATVGSAVGLGNIWRFPAEAQAGGGSAFLLVYIVCVCVLGIPVMLAEFAVGRTGRTDAIGVFGRITPGRRGWGAVGILSVLISYLISIFYMVVTGWTLCYLYESLTGGLYDAPGAYETGFFSGKMEEYIQSTGYPLVFTLLAILLNIGVLLAGVGKGIERLSNVLMPLLFMILVALCVATLTLPGSGEGLRYFIVPDMSKLTPQVWLSGLGQAFFSLSLGMGILITYSGYFPKRTHLVQTSVAVSWASVLVALFVGMTVFPAIFAFGMQDGGVGGTTLVFVTLPEVFANMGGTRVWSSLFFLLLAIAALTSTVSISEVSIRCLQDRMHLSRRTAVAAVTGSLMILSGICSQSFGSLSHVTLLGQNMFNLLDNLTAKYMLPVAAMGVCIYVGWVAPRGLLRSQLTNGGTLRSRLAAPALLAIRFIAPLLILLVLISS